GVIGRVSETAQLSAGIVTYPDHGVERSELMRVADSALYLAKEHGKNRVRVYRPDLLELAELRRLAEGPDRAARLRAAASLAHAVDARDAYTGSHSYMVGELGARGAKKRGRARAPARHSLPRPCGRCPRCLHGLALLHGRRAGGTSGQEDGARERPGRARPPGRLPARPRQARHPRGDPQKARPPERGRAPRPR